SRCTGVVSPPAVIFPSRGNSCLALFRSRRSSCAGFEWCARWKKKQGGQKTTRQMRTFLCESPTTQSPVLGASMPHVPFLGARQIVFSICVHGLRAYHALNQYRIRYEDMRCKSLVLAPLRLFGF